MKLNKKKIEAELKRLGWSYSDYARKLGVSRQLLNYYINGQGGGAKALSVIERMAKPLLIDPKDLID
jgi:transcriptional regulator with XRE-family HTH domain